MMQATVDRLERLEGRGRSSDRGRILVVGLDGATFDLIKPWAEEGYLPTLGRLMEQGAHGVLQSTIPPMTAPAWTSFATGTNPGKHRLYDWIARETDSYKFTPVTALDGKVPTIFSLLSSAGRKVCSLNVPMTYPPQPVNGVMVSGMPAPNMKVRITYPDGLLQEIVENVGDYMLYPDPGQAYSDSGIRAFLDRLYRCTELRVRTFDYLRARDQWDFAMIVFNGTDTVSHAMWKFMDPGHPLHDSDDAHRYGTAIRDYYAFVDEQLGELVDSLGDDTTLIVMSDHGFGPFHKFIHVNNWLMREGFMRVKAKPLARAKQTLFRLGFAPMNVYDLLMRIGLGSLKREVVRGQGQSLLKALFLSFEDIDWNRTVAYSLGNVGQICLNVTGREPLGCVKPGPEYHETREKLIERLADLRDPETGEPVVEAVYRREEIYSGVHLDSAPDIMFIPRRLEYFGFGEYEFGSHRVIESMRRGISGTHRLNGIFLAYGGAIQAGQMIHGARIEDLAPTMLHIMGEPVPDHMDGRVLLEILTSELQARPVRTGAFSTNGQPIRKGETGLMGEPVLTGVAGSNGYGLTEQAGSGEAPAVVLSEEDRNALAERLRSLGYVG